MAEMVACLHHGTVEVLRQGQAAQRLESPYRQRLSASDPGPADARIVGVTRGRTSGELCYVIASAAGSEVFAQVPGTGKEQRLFHGSDIGLSELDFSVADAALACTVAGARGTSAIGVLADDGKGVRTVTEGDVIDRAPRWTPGGRAQIVYSSAGIGRTRGGRAVGRSPFALHRLRFSDNSVEVLIADARYDYTAVVQVSESSFYALRRSYEQTLPLSPLGGISGVVRSLFARAGRERASELQRHELVRISDKGSERVAKDVVAFDLAANEDVIYSDGAGIFRLAARQTTPEPLLDLEGVEQLVIGW
jgi:hypothetical protein